MDDHTNQRQQIMELQHGQLVRAWWNYHRIFPLIVGQTLSTPCQQITSYGRRYSYLYPIIPLLKLNPVIPQKSWSTSTKVQHSVNFINTGTTVHKFHTCRIIWHASCPVELVLNQSYHKNSLHSSKPHAWVFTVQSKFRSLKLRLISWWQITHKMGVLENYDSH